MIPGRFLRRALLRGGAAAGLAAAAGACVPGERRATSSMAGAAALATGATLELPAAGPLLATAAVLAAARSHRPAPPPAVAVLALGAGAAIALATRRFWPVAPRTPARARAALTPVAAGSGGQPGPLTVVVNESAGPAGRRSPTERLQESLPEARVVCVDDGADVVAALEAATPDAAVLGISGGDGSISAAAGVAHATGKPLLVVPGGTLNHLCRDLGLDDPADAVAAFREGRTVAVDVGTIDGRVFVNTASFGSYADLVDARERLESRIGKWPAVLVALARVLRHSTPVHVELDGRPRRLWMIFMGNCRYHPAGFAPSWRERLDDGCLDVRLVDAAPPLARIRLVASVLTGRLGRCRVYEAFTTDTLHVRALDGPLRLAHDGETFDGSAEFLVRKEDRPLAVYVPSPGD